MNKLTLKMSISYIILVVISASASLSFQMIVKESSDTL